MATNSDAPFVDQVAERVKDLELETNYANRVKIKWNSSGADYYKVYRAEGEEEFTLLEKRSLPGIMLIQTLKNKKHINIK